MSELKEYEEDVIKQIQDSGGQLKPQEYLSPTSINDYFKCPRCYFYKYIAKLKTKPTIHLVKGGIIHKTLEDFYKKYEPNLEEHLMSLFEKAWNEREQALKDLELSEEELKKHKEDSIEIVKEYYITISRRINAMLKAEKVENERHAFYMLKPKLREKYYKNEKLKTKGFVDRIHKDFNDVVTVGDYKTSSKYGIGLPDANRRQLAIYSLLYKEEEGQAPDYAAIIYLRYGEEVILEVTPSLLKFARNTIDYVYSKTRSIDINDYPVGQGNLIKWCEFADLHDGTAEWEELYRREKLKQSLSKKEEPESRQLEKGL